MRRRRPNNSPTMRTAGILLTDAPKPFRDDPEMPYPLRRKAYQRWDEQHAAWIARRDEWADTNGWPGGVIKKAQEEQDYLSHCDDQPFDPAWELAHGNL